MAFNLFPKSPGKGKASDAKPRPDAGARPERGRALRCALSARVGAGAGGDDEGSADGADARRAAPVRG